MNDKFMVIQLASITYIRWNLSKFNWYKFQLDYWNLTVYIERWLFAFEWIRQELFELLNSKKKLCHAKIK
jgi:hypothetical protein